MSDLISFFNQIRKIRTEEGILAASNFIENLDLSTDIKKNLYNSAIGEEIAQEKTQESLQINTEGIYSFYLRDLEKKYGKEVSNSINNTIKGTVNRIEINNSEVKNSVDAGYGLVIGRIQSGKTAHLLGLALHSLDKSFNDNSDIVIILSGLINDLKKQTYDRLSSSISGFGEAAPKIIPDREEDLSENNNSLALLDYYIENPHEGGLVILIKKNCSVLAHLYSTLVKSKAIKKRKIIIIDDESDHASIDSSEEKDHFSSINEDPSETNRLLRQIINMIKSNPLSWYIGYTATPFANLLIPDVLSVEDKYGRSLAPRNFVHSLPKTPGHLDNEFYFTSDNNNVEIIDNFEQGSQEEENLIRDLIIRHIITGEIKKNRDIADHHTTLVHASVKTDVHQRISSLIRNKIDELSCITECEDIINEDPNKYISHRSIHDINLKQILIPEGDEYFDYLISLLGKIKVVEVNSRIRDEDENSPQNLIYNNNKKSYIAVGGTRLSRGLTLEGLTNSCFTRFSEVPKYDSMMQMARWCGYRNDYDDLVKIVVTEPIFGAFRDIAIAEADLRQKIEAIPPEGKPIDYDIWIIEHPGMSVTAPEKMREVRRKSWGRMGTTPFFSHDNPLYSTANRVNTSNILYSSVRILVEDTNLLINEWHKPPKGESNFILAKDIPNSYVYDFLKSYKDSFESDNQTKNKLEILLDPNNQEVNNWNIALHIPQRKSKIYNENIAGPDLELRLVNRSLNEEKNKFGRITNSADDVTIDLALGESRVNPLLIIYLVDPASTKNAAIDGEPVFHQDISVPLPLFGICMPSNNNSGIIDYVARKG